MAFTFNNAGELCILLHFLFFIYFTPLEQELSCPRWRSRSALDEVPAMFLVVSPCYFIFAVCAARVFERMIMNGCNMYGATNCETVIRYLK